MEETMKKIANHISTKYSRTLKIEQDKSEFTINFPIPIDLDPNFNYELGLIWLATYNSICNITSKNNTFKYTDDKNVVKEIKLSPGAYEIDQINNEVNKVHKDLKIEIYLPTSKTKLTIPPNYKVDFTIPNSFRTLLGFENKVYESGTHFSENKIDITNISSINIDCDLISGNYDNGVQSNILYSFPAYTVPAGYRIIERAYTPIYLPITRKNISKIHFRILDQDDNLLDLNGEKISMRLHLKQV